MYGDIKISGSYLYSLDFHLYCENCGVVFTHWFYICSNCFRLKHIYTIYPYNADCNRILVYYFLRKRYYFTDANPAVQGSSLTEGKRGKRTKKQGDVSVNGDGRSHSPSNNGEDEVDSIIAAPIKNANNVSSLVVKNY